MTKRRAPPGRCHGKQKRHCCRRCDQAGHRADTCPSALGKAWRELRAKKSDAWCSRKAERLSCVCACMQIRSCRAAGHCAGPDASLQGAGSLTVAAQESQGLCNVLKNVRKLLATSLYSSLTTPFLPLPQRARAQACQVGSLSRLRARMHSALLQQRQASVKHKLAFSIVSWPQNKITTELN